MNRCFCAIALMLALTLPTTSAADPAEPPTCLSPFSRIGTVFYERSAANDLQFYRYATGKGRLYRQYRGEDETSADIWAQRLSTLGLAPSGMNVPDHGYHETRCNYPAAVRRLDERMRTLGRDHSYVTIWAKNQMTVFENCEQTREGFTLPSSPGRLDAAVASMGARDFAYQTASAYFYAGYWKEAVAAYSAIYADVGSPYHGLAGYMAARSLLHDDQPQQATGQLRTVLADPRAADVRVIAETLMDVVAYGSDDVGLLTEQLQRNAAILEMPAEELTATDELMTKYEQATIDLSWFLRGPSYDFPLDWWLSEADLGPYNERAKATRAVARSSDVIDWLQTMTSSDFFRQHGWLALFSTQVQSAGYDAVTRHAVQRWRESGAIHWELAVLMRAKPTDAVAAEFPPLLDAVERRIADCQATFDDRMIYSTLLYHTIRLLAMSGETDRALALVEGRAKAPNSMGAAAYADFFRWLVGRGEIDTARRLDGLFRKPYPPGSRSDLIPLRQIIATDLDDFLAAGSGNPVSDSTASVINLLPVDVLARLIDSKHLVADDRIRLSRMAWTRAYLLNRTDLLDGLTLKLRLLNPNLDLHFDRVDAAGSDSERRNLLTYLMLETPRLGLRFNARDSELASHWGKYRQDLFDIDGSNPDDNNWWCRFDRAAYQATLQRQFYELALRPPTRWEYREPAFSDSDMAAFNGIRDRVLANHPVLKLVDEAELAALAQIDSGPVYLGQRTLAWANDRGWFPWWSRDDPLLPKTLHLAVRATRYGCYVDARYGDVSRAAFLILQERFPDSPWTTITPYWYGTRSLE